MYLSLISRSSVQLHVFCCGSSSLSRVHNNIVCVCVQYGGKKARIAGKSIHKSKMCCRIFPDFSMPFSFEQHKLYLLCLFSFIFFFWFRLFCFLCFLSSFFVCLCSVLASRAFYFYFHLALYYRCVSSLLLYTQLLLSFSFSVCLCMCVCAFGFTVLFEFA